MASQQSLQPKPHPPRHAKSFDRLVGILRTRRFKPAASCKQNGQVGFVESQREQRRSHRQRRSRAYAFFSSSSNSALNSANRAFAAALFGCMTMSHPAGNSCRWQRTISRSRRRIRLRTTAPPSVFFMLNPKRLCGCSLARKNTVKWRLERRLPARYTASNSPRLNSRASRGNLFSSAPKPPGFGLKGFPELFGGEPMASLLAARRQHLTAACCLHACAESVRLRASASPRLKCALWQTNPPLFYAIAGAALSPRDALPH